VEFGRYLKVQPHEGYVIGHCRKSPKESTPLSPDVVALLEGRPETDPHDGAPAARVACVEHKEAVFTQLKEAMASIKSADRALPEVKNPYQGPTEAVRRLAFDISKDRNTLLEKIDSLVDTLRPFVSIEDEAVHPRLPENDSAYTFELDRGFVMNRDFQFVPDRVHFAGDILAQPEREVIDPGSGAKIRKLVHDLEPVFLAAAVLRHLDTEGYAVYPSLAICRDPMPLNESALAYVPLVALVNTEAEIPLQTFTLLRQHPEMGSIMILSDTAMAGILHLVLAENRLKRLCIEMTSNCVKSGTLLPDLVPRLEAIADALFEYYVACPNASLMDMTTDFMYHVTLVSFNFVDVLIPQTIAHALQADASFGSLADVNAWPPADQVAWYLMNHVKGRFGDLVAKNPPGEV
jgi:hypothetical protein